MRILLNIVYALLIVAVSPWLIYAAARHGKYREGFAEKFLGHVPRREGNSPCVWLHAVSVGEVNLLGTMIATIESKHPDWQCVISTTTKTGMEVARKKYPQHIVFYCPLDFSWAVRAALKRIRPSLLLLAELELWPNLIRETKAYGASACVFNGRLSENSFRGYHRVRSIVRPLLRQMDLIAVQDQQYCDRFLALGARTQCVKVTGSLKYDGAQTNRKNEKTRKLAKLAGFADDDTVFLAGSTQDPEEQMAIAAFTELSQNHARLRLVIVPRHPERFDAVAAMLTASGVRWQRRSQLEDDGADSQSRILLVDTVGELGAWWGTASIAFVGGSMGDRGGQNMIEPAAYGAAVCFGPNTRNFRDVVEHLLEVGAAAVVRDEHELTQFVGRALDSPAFAANLGQRAQQFVLSQLGATDRTLAAIERSCPLPKSEPLSISTADQPLDRDAA